MTENDTRDDQPQPEPAEQEEPKAEPEPEAEQAVEREAEPAEGGGAGEGQRTGEGQRISAQQAARRAVDYMDEMTGETPEMVTAVERGDDDGWLVKVEVLELARVPDTTDVLACYEVELAADGEPGAYRRTRRYHRGRIGEE